MGAGAAALQEGAELQAALEKLAENPDDNESHRIAGEFLCFDEIVLALPQ